MSYLGICLSHMSSSVGFVWSFRSGQPGSKKAVSFTALYFFSTGDWAQGLTYARQALYQEDTFSLFWKEESAKLPRLALALLCSLGRPGTSHPSVSASWIASITGLHQQVWPALHINFTSSWMVTPLFNPTRYLYQLPFTDSLVCGLQVPRCLYGGQGTTHKSQVSPFTMWVLRTGPKLCGRHLYLLSHCAGPSPISLLDLHHTETTEYLRSKTNINSSTIRGRLSIFL